MQSGMFVWDGAKEAANIAKHGVDFTTAAKVFFDPLRIIAADSAHSQTEDRKFCLGRVGDTIITVRFTEREGKIRLIGAGYWRKGKQLYEKTNRKV